MYSGPRRLRVLLPGLLAVLLLGHVGLTVLYLLPPNPITLRLAPILARTMLPFFAQDWRLFAPTPINDTRRLLLSCRLRQADGTAVETAWVDVTTPWWDAQAHNRLSAAAWLSRPQDYAVQQYFAQSDLPGRPAHERAEPGSALDQLAAEIQAAQHERHVLASRILARIGAASCDRWYGAGQTVATRFQLTVLRFPRFSERHLPDSAGTLRPYLLEWLPYEPVALLVTRSLGD